MRRNRDWVAEPIKRQARRSHAKAWLKENATPQVLELLYEHLMDRKLIDATLRNEDRVDAEVEMLRDVYQYLTGRRAIP